MILELDNNTEAAVLAFLVDRKMITRSTARAASCFTKYLRLYINAEDYRKAKPGEKVRVRATTRRKN